MDREGWQAAVHGVSKSWTPELNWVVATIGSGQFHSNPKERQCQGIFKLLYNCAHFLFCFQSLSHVQLFATSWTAACQASLSFTISWSLLKLMSIESVMPSNYLILCYPLLLLPSIFPSIRVFSNELVLRIRWPKYWSFSFSISPSSEYSWLISFRICFDLLAVQGTLMSLLQHHSSKASLLWCSAFFIVSFLVHTWLLEKP